MTKIKGIEIKNFKGNNIVQKLSGKDIFIGPNGTGKSSRLQGLMFTMLGYIPDYGKKLLDLYQFSSNESNMSTVLETDGDFKVERTISKKIIKKKDGDKEEKLEEDIILTPSRSEKNLTKKKERIALELGDFPIMLNFLEFTEKSDSEKRKFIYELTGVNSSWNKETIGEYLKENLITKKVKEDSDLLKQVSWGIQKTMEQYPEKFEPEVAIEHLIDWLNNKKEFWKKEEKSTKGMLEKLSEFKNESDDTLGNLTESKQQLEKLNLELIDLQKKIAVAQEIKKHLDIQYDKMKKLQLEINNLKDPKNSIDEEKKIKEDIAELNKKINKKKFPDFSNALAQQILIVKQQIKEKREICDKIVADGSKEKAEIEFLEKNVSNIQNCNGVCVINPQIKCDKDFDEFVSYAKKSIKNKYSEKKTLLAKYQNIKKEIVKEEQLLSKLEKDKENLLKEERTANKNNSDIQRKINDLTSKLHEIDKNKSLKEQNLQSKVSEFESIKKELKEKEGQVNCISDFQNKIHLIETDKDNLEKIIDSQEKSKTNTENLKKAMIQNRKATKIIALIKNISDTLGPKGLQGKILKENLDPMANSINENLKAIGIKREFFFQCSSSRKTEIFHFGWIDEEGRKINFNTLSDGEKAMFLIAFLTAIIEKKNPKIRILAIDKIECIDEENLVNLIKGLKILENKLDNIMLCGRILDKNILTIAENEGFVINNLNPSLRKEPKIQTIKNEEEAI